MRCTVDISSPWRKLHAKIASDKSSITKMNGEKTRWWRKNLFFFLKTKTSTVEPLISSSSRDPVFIPLRDTARWTCAFVRFPTAGVCACVPSHFLSRLFRFSFLFVFLFASPVKAALFSLVMLCFDLRFCKKNFRLDQKLIVWYLFRLKKRIKKPLKKISKGSPLCLRFWENFKKKWSKGGVLAFSPPGFVKCATRCNEICFL